MAARKKTEAVATEVLKLDGSKTVIKNEDTPKTSRKKGISKKTNPVKEEFLKKTNKESFEVIEKSEKSIINEDKNIDKSQKKTTSSKKKSVGKSTDIKSSEDKEFEDLVNRLSDAIIEKLSKVFIPISEAENLVIQTIQKLAIGELRPDIKSPEITE